MSSTRPVPIDPRPGFNRDGTRLDNDQYLDGSWVRFYRGRPQKIGGYRFIAGEIPGRSRTLHVDHTQGISKAFCGSSSGFYQFDVDTNFNASPISDRTPAGMTNDQNRLWQISQMFDAAGSNSLIIAHPNINLSNIDSSTNYTVYAGLASVGTPLTPLNPTDGRNEVCGGICVIPPYLFLTCNNGFITWSGPNTPFTFTIASGGGGSAGARISDSKIIKGMPFRGNQGPSGVFFSLDSVIKAQFVGGAVQWAFNTVATKTSALSSSGFVEYNSAVYWPGVDKFYLYDGTVKELINESNAQWFFDNLNTSRRQTVFGVNFPGWGETWWCFPYRDSLEPNAAIIYNHKYKIWYDTMIPRGVRMSGVHPSVINIPMMTSLDYKDQSKSWLLAHEVGTDDVNLYGTDAIRSYIDTSEISLTEAGADQNIRIDRLDLDLIQDGLMSLSIVGRNSSRQQDVESPVIQFTEEDDSIDLKQERRHMRLRFESFHPSGNYKLGRCMAYVSPGSKRRG
jgi:hypothetical protein